MITVKQKLKIKKNIRDKNSDNDSDSSGGPNEKISKEDMDYNAPKPGPHAKVD